MRARRWRAQGDGESLVGLVVGVLDGNHIRRGGRAPGGDCHGSAGYRSEIGVRNRRVVAFDRGRIGGGHVEAAHLRQAHRKRDRVALCRARVGDADRGRVVVIANQHCARNTHVRVFRPRRQCEIHPKCFSVYLPSPFVEVVFQNLHLDGFGGFVGRKGQAAGNRGVVVAGICVIRTTCIRVVPGLVVHDHLLVDRRRERNAEARRGIAFGNLYAHDLNNRLFALDRDRVGFLGCVGGGNHDLERILAEGQIDLVVVFVRVSVGRRRVGHTCGAACWRADDGDLLDTDRNHGRVARCAGGERLVQRYGRAVRLCEGEGAERGVRIFPGVVGHRLVAERRSHVFRLVLDGIVGRDRVGNHDRIPHHRRGRQRQGNLCAVDRDATADRDATDRDIRAIYRHLEGTRRRRRTRVQVFIVCEDQHIAVDGRRTENRRSSVGRVVGHGPVG